jgi:predicted SAM-dependent methyltransferase
MNEFIFLHIQKPHSLPVGVVYDNVINIDNYQNNTIENIIITDLLDYYVGDESLKVLRLIYEKIANEGSIQIQAPDIKQLAVALLSEELSQNDVRDVLYPSKKNIHSIYDIENMAKQIGAKIANKKYINVFEYYIVIQKK